MKITNRSIQTLLVLACLLFSFATAEAQKRKVRKAVPAGNAVLWESVDVSSQDLYFGPGGEAMLPDLSRIRFIKEEKGGYSTKYRIEDGAGNVWVAKTGLEAQSETASVRIMSGIGYKTEINYLVPTMTIPGKGTFSNVRLEARPANVDRGKAWKWGRTPFERTRQMQGLKIMMAFLNNWDMKSANNVILHKGNERQYVISDLGVTFGKTGNNPLPLFWRMGRSRNNPVDYSKAKFISGVSRNRVKIVFNGKNRSRLKDITRADARWLADLLTQLSDKQIEDAFRAANYSQADIALLTTAVKDRIEQLDRAGGSGRLATNR